MKLESTHTIEIDSFVPRSEIDNRYLDKPYYLAPSEKVGGDAFAVICDAMKNKDRNPDRLRGNYLDGVVMDEFGDMRPSIWGEVIRPMLADRGGWATFIGTPKGRNEFAKVFERSQSNPDWFSAMLRASQTGILPEDELASALEDMTPEQYEQEFECSFDAAITGAYFGKEMAQADREGRIRDLHYDPDLPVHTSWNLGIGDPTAIWFWQITGQEIRIIVAERC